MGGEQPQPLAGGRRERGLTDLEKEMREAKLRAGTGNWEGVKGGTLIGLYALCHQAVYEVLPEELKEKATFTEASRRASIFLRRNFGGDVSQMVLFIKWCWAREKKREEYAKAKNFDRNRLTWQKQLMTYLITDYNLDRKKAERA
jgi:hypothetical protein